MQYNAQGVYLFAHGVLDPTVYSPLSGFPYRADHGEFLMYAFAPFARIFSTLWVLKVAQDLTVVAASALVFFAVAREIDALPSARTRWAVRLLALALLILDPWPYWANAFDVHVQVIGTVFVVAAVVAAYRGKRRWTFAALICAVGFGDVVCTYVVGVALTLLLRPRFRLTGLVVFVCAAVAFELITISKPHVNNPANIGSLYAYVLEPGRNPAAAGFGEILAGALHHPGRVAARAVSALPNLYANVAPVGYAGWLNPWSVGVSAVAFAETMFTVGSQFSQPGFQGAVTYPLGAFGTLLFVLAALRVRPRSANWVVAFLFVNVALWAAVFFPLLPRRWIRYDAAEGRALARIHAQVPPDAQVLASQGAVGAFALRRLVFYDAAAMPSLAYPTETEIVLTPYAGINAPSSTEVAVELGWWLFDRHATLISHDRDVWYLRAAPVRWSTVAVPPFDRGPIPAWALHLDGARAVVGTTAATSYAEIDGARGLVISRGYVFRPPGSYHAAFDYASDGPLLLEVYEPNTRAFIGRRVIPAHARRSSEGIDIQVSPDVPDALEVQAGIGPFRYTPVASRPGQAYFEVRLYSKGGVRARVYDLNVTPS